MKIILTLILALFPLASFATVSETPFIGNSMTGFTVSCSSFYEYPGFPSKPCENALGFTNDYWFTSWTDVVNNIAPFIRINLASPKSFGRVALKGYGSPDVDFKSFVLKASNDTISWTDLYNSAGTPSLNGTTKYYDFTNNNSYSYYKVQFTSFNNTNSDIHTLAYINFYENVFESPACLVSGTVNAPITQNSPLCSVGTVSNFSSLGSSPISYTWSCVSGTSVSCGSTYTPPAPITGYFDAPVTVASGSYNWNLVLHLSTGAIISDSTTIQMWDMFKIVSYTPNSDSTQITFSLSQKDNSPLSVACGNYTMSIPSSNLQGLNGLSANASAITASFIVTGCPSGGNENNTGSTNTGGTLSGVTLADSGTYLILGQTINGVFYINSDGFYYLLLALSLFVSIIYSLYRWATYLLVGKYGLSGKK